jgi:hypothetical protein
MSEYGTLEPLREEKRTSKKSIYVVVGVLACVALLSLGAATGFAKPSEAVDNKGRAKATPVCPSVQKAFQNVCDRYQKAAKKTKKHPAIPSQMRFSIAGLTKKKGTYTLVPMVSYGASDDWINDWQTFKNMMPDSRPSVGFGIFNFPVWTDPRFKSKARVIPTFVTYQRSSSNLASKYLGGSFLGGALLAGSGTIGAGPKFLPKNDELKAGEKRACAVTQITVTARTTYEQACYTVVKNSPGNKFSPKQIWAMCRAVRVSSCPFSRAGPAPCCKSTRKCTKPCATVARWMGNKQYPAKCCAAIKSWCKGGGKQGCTRFQMAIYARNCDPSYGTKKFPTLKILQGLREKPRCLRACRRPCTFFKKKKATYQMCAGCSHDQKPHNYGKAGTFRAMCYPRAHGFLNFRCCGAAAACAKGFDKQCQLKTTKAMTAAKVQCKWVQHRACGKIIAAQKLAMSPVGCCGGKNGVKKILCKKKFALGKCPPPPKKKVAKKPAAKKPAAKPAAKKPKA